VDDNCAAASGKEPCIGSTEAASCAGHDDDLAVKANRGQGYAGSSVKAVAKAVTVATRTARSLMPANAMDLLPGSSQLSAD
jgi:hypothetical protein